MSTEGSKKLETFQSSYFIKAVHQIKRSVYRL